MNLPGGMTIFDEFGNFNLLHVVNVGGDFQFSRVKSCPARVDLKSYTPRFCNGSSLGLLLDSLELNAESPESLFYLQRDSVSFAMGNVPEWELEKLLEAKARLFLLTRNRVSENGITDLRFVSVQGTYHGKSFESTPLSATAAFNPAALAILSLPAYFVLDIRSVASLGKNTECFGRFCIYNHQAPAFHPTSCHESESIESLEDYMQVFHYGNFLQNNSDAWVTIYGLAYCIAVLVADIRRLRIPERCDSMDDFIRYTPFNWLYSELVHLGALHDPFDSSRVIWDVCQCGIENAREVSEYLYSALRLAELVQPFPISTDLSRSVNSIFYGLVDVFNLREYFGIDPWVRFVYPQ